MSDKDWVRSYANKKVYTSTVMRADTKFQSPIFECMDGMHPNGKPGMYWPGHGALSLYAIKSPKMSREWNNTIRTEGNFQVKKLEQSSDERIKRNIEDINKEDALEKVMKLKLKKYDLMDDDKSSYGIIAQEVKEVIPNTVKTHANYIPNIKLTVKCDSNKLYIKDYKIKENSILKVLVTNDGNTTEFRCVVKQINSDHIVVDNVLDDVECYIYGTEVEDFHTVDTNSIFSLNISATQKLFEILESQKKEIELLKETVALLKK